MDIKYVEAGPAEVLTFDEESSSIEIPADLPPKARVMRRMSPTRASWLIVSRSEKLDEQQRKYVKQIREAHPDLEIAYQLGQRFVL